MKMLKITIRNHRGRTGYFPISEAEWKALSPANKVLTAHAELRGLTEGRPFAFEKIEEAPKTAAAQVADTILKLNSGINWERKA